MPADLLYWGLRLVSPCTPESSSTMWIRRSLHVDEVVLLLVPVVGGILVWSAGELGRCYPPRVPSFWQTGTTRSYCHEMYIKFLGKGVAIHENGHENRVIGSSSPMNYPWKMIWIVTTYENHMTFVIWKTHGFTRVLKLNENYDLRYEKHDFSAL